MIRKLFIIIITLLFILPNSLYAQAKPRRDQSKDNSVLVAKKKENERKNNNAKKTNGAKRQISKKPKSSVNVNATPPQATFLYINQQSYLYQSFRYNGESKYFSVRTDGKTWNIASTPDWCIIRKYSDSFIVNCNPNPYHDDRDGKIRITSDTKEAWIDITQPGTPLNIEASIDDVYLRHNVFKSLVDYSCLEINAKVTIKGAWGQKCLIVAKFYDEYGNKILANSKYLTYALGSNQELYGAIDVVPTSDYPQQHTVSFYIPNNAMLFWGKKKNLQCRLYIYCEKTRTYIDEVYYNINFKAKNKKGNITTKKRK